MTSCFLLTFSRSALWVTYPPSSSEIRPSFSMEGPLLAIPGCESSAVRSLLLGSTRNCHCSTRQPNYTNQWHKTIRVARRRKVVTHNLPTEEGVTENMESTYKFKRHAIQQNSLKLFISFFLFVCLDKNLNRCHNITQKNTETALKLMWGKRRKFIWV